MKINKDMYKTQNQENDTLHTLISFFVSEKNVCVCVKKSPSIIDLSKLLQNLYFCARIYKSK